MPRSFSVSESLALRILAVLPEDALRSIASQQLTNQQSYEFAMLASQLDIVRRMREQAKNDPERVKGLYEKYVVQRVDGSTEAGGKHEHCRHFVLDPDHDPIAKACLNFYADLCESTYPQLANDLRKLARTTT